VFILNEIVLWLLFKSNKTIDSDFLSQYRIEFFQVAFLKAYLKRKIK